MQTPECTTCHEPMEADALSCPSCGTPVELEPGKKLGPLTSIIGALFVIIGPFFPWLEAGMESTSGIAETRKRALIFLGLGVFAVMMALSALTGKKFTGFRGNIMTGALSSGLAIYYFVELRNLVSIGDADDLALGKGLYFCLVGSIVIFVGGVMTVSRRR